MAKKILQISNYYHPDIGGIEKIAQAISESLFDSFDIRVLCFSHNNESKNEIVDHVKVIRCGTNIKIASQQISARMISEIKEQITSFSPDYVIIHTPNPFTEFFLLHHIPPKCRLIVYWHSDIIKQRFGNIFFTLLTERLLMRADLVIATSPNYIEGSHFLSKYRNKCVVIPNCIEYKSLELTPNATRVLKEIKEKYHDKHICICVGRQVPYKGFKYAIQAINMLNDSFILFIIGRKGESTKELVKLAQKSKRIVFLGEIDNDTMHAYMAACEIFCFPSITKNEAFGIALAEGMFYNKPAVTFTIPGSGVNYVCVGEKTGIEVANKNVHDYAKALQYLADHKDIREKYGQAAGKHIRDMFMPDQFKNNIRNALSGI